MTSVGLLMRLYLGWRRDNPNMVKGAEYLAENLPAIGTGREPQRDTYYWYYATQVMFHMGGEYWQQWNDQTASAAGRARRSSRARWPAVGTRATPSPTAGRPTPAGCT